MWNRTIQSMTNPPETTYSAMDLSVIQCFFSLSIYHNFFNYILWKIFEGKKNFCGSVKHYFKTAVTNKTCPTSNMVLFRNLSTCLSFRHCVINILTFYLHSVKVVIFLLVIVRFPSSHQPNQVHVCTHNPCN